MAVLLPPTDESAKTITEIPDLRSSGSKVNVFPSGSKAKASFSKHKQKSPSKHHKTDKKESVKKPIKKSVKKSLNS